MSFLFNLFKKMLKNAHHDILEGQTSSQQLKNNWKDYNCTVISNSEKQEILVSEADKWETSKTKKSIIPDVGCVIE